MKFLPGQITCYCPSQDNL